MQRFWKLSLITLVLTLALPAGTAWAEEERKSFQLKNGHVVVGVVVDEGDSGYLVRTPEGETVRVSYDAIEGVIVLGSEARENRDEGSKQRAEEESRYQEDRRYEEEQRYKKERKTDRGGARNSVNPKDLRYAKLRHGVSIGLGITAATLMGTGFATLGGSYAALGGVSTGLLITGDILDDDLAVATAAPSFVGAAIQHSFVLGLGAAAGNWARSGLKRLGADVPGKGLSVTGIVLGPVGLGMLYTSSIAGLASGDGDTIAITTAPAVIGLNLLICGEVLVLIDAVLSRRALTKALKQVTAEQRYHQRWQDQRRASFLPFVGPQDGGVSFGVSGLLP